MSRMTADRIRTLVQYDPATGALTWVGRPRVKGGKRVGSAHSKGYIEARIGDVRMFAHQAAWLWMTGEWPTFQIDHINGNRSDNRWENLRAASQALNSANMKRRSRNKSGFKGVVRNGNSWVAYIHIDGKTNYLGSFKTPEIASNAYMSAAKSAWGDFARVD